MRPRGWALIPRDTCVSSSGEEEMLGVCTHGDGA